MDCVDGSGGNRSEHVDYSEEMKRKLKRGRRELRLALTVELYIRCTLLRMMKTIVNTNGRLCDIYMQETGGW